jgi:hypothetical protein
VPLEVVYVQKLQTYRLTRYKYCGILCSQTKHLFVHTKNAWKVDASTFRSNTIAFLMSRCFCFLCNLNFFDQVKIGETILQDIIMDVAYNYSLHVRMSLTMMLKSDNKQTKQGLMKCHVGHHIPATRETDSCRSSRRGRRENKGIDCHRQCLRR